MKRLPVESELLEDVQQALPSAASVVLFAPHPDDEVFGAGGTLALFAQKSCSIQVVIVTDGALGGDDSEGTLIATREAESTAAAAILGIPAPVFWREPDRSLSCNETLIQRIVETVQASGADLVILPSLLEIHPDHQALALAGIEALRRLGGPVRALFYELNAPLPMPNLLIDITPVMSVKRRAMDAFASQLKEQPYSQRIAGLNQFRSYFMGAEASAAEAFFMITASDIDATLPFLFEGALSCRRRRGFPVDQKDFPLISIIVRSMDRPSLDEALRSIALQTYDNCEVVIVNAKGETHRPLGNSCGRFPLRMINAGRALQRSDAANVGLKQAEGELLIFLDDDDYFLPHHLQRLAERLAQGLKAPAAYSAVRGIDDSGAEKLVFAREFDATDLLVDNYIPIHSVLFRRSAVDAGIRFDTRFGLYEDWDFWLQLAQLGDFLFEPEIGAVYRISSQENSGAWTDPARCRAAAASIHRKHFSKISDEALESLLDYSRRKRLVDSLETRFRGAGFSGNSLTELIDAALHRLHQESVMRVEQSKIMEAQGRQIEEQRQTLSEQTSLITAQTNRIEEQDQRITAQTNRIEEQDQHIARQSEEIRQIFSSTSWRCTAPLRWLKRQLGNS